MCVCVSNGRREYTVCVKPQELQPVQRRHDAETLRTRYTTRPPRDYMREPRGTEATGLESDIISTEKELEQTLGAWADVVLCVMYEIPPPSLSPPLFQVP